MGLMERAAKLAWVSATLGVAAITAGAWGTFGGPDPAWTTSPGIVVVGAAAQPGGTRAATPGAASRAAGRPADTAPRRTPAAASQPAPTSTPALTPR